MNAIASGVTVIAGLSYVNIRTVKHERPLRIAMCHFFKLLGFAATYTIYLFLFHNANNQQTNNENLREFYQIFGYTIIGSTAFFLLLLMINELLQRQGLVYNYRDCLDHDNSIANNYCKLFSRNEVVIERNTTVSSAGLWKSAENILPQYKNNLFTTLWTIYMLIPKLHGAILFHYFLMTLSMNAANSSFTGINYVHGIVLWLMIIEALIGCVLLRFVHCKKVYVATSVGAVIAIGVSIVFYGEWPPTNLAICLWVYYAAIAISIAIPDIALLEMSKIRYNEGVLAAGYFVEIIPIAVLQLVHREAHILTILNWYNEKYFIAYAVASIVILIVTSAIYILHLPNTFNKSLLQIQNELLKHKGYFVFMNGTVANSTNNNNNNNIYNDIQKNDLMNAHTLMDGPRERSGTESTINTYAELHASSDQLPPVNVKNQHNIYSNYPHPAKLIPRVNLTRTPTSDKSTNA